MKMPEKEENQLDKEGNGQGNVEEIMEKEKLYIKINMEQEEGIMNILEREERMLTILRENMQRKERKEPKEEEDGSSEKQTIENIEEKNIENLK